MYRINELTIYEVLCKYTVQGIEWFSQAVAIYGSAYYELSLLLLTVNDVSTKSY